VYIENTGCRIRRGVRCAASMAGPRVIIQTASLRRHVALAGTSFSDDGRYMAYATSASGSDWMTWRIREVMTGNDLDDEVRWSKFSTASWLLDGSGFYIAVTPSGLIDAIQRRELHHKVYFHRSVLRRHPTRSWYETARSSGLEPWRFVATTATADR